MKKVRAVIILMIGLISCKGEFSTKRNSEIESKSSKDLIEETKTTNQILKIEPFEYQKIDTAIWMDTLIDRKFLKMYSTSIDNYKDIIANWGNDNQSHSFNFQSDSAYHHIWRTYSSELLWSTKKAICIPKGCGQSCVYGIIFHSEKEKPFLIEPQLAFYPNITYRYFESDNDDLYLTLGDFSIIVNSADTGLTDTIKLTKDWDENRRPMVYMFDEVKILNNEIEIIQEDDDKILKIKHRIKLKFILCVRTDNV